MNELIKVNKSQSGKDIVSARELYVFLTDEIQMTNAMAWMTRNIVNNKFADDGIDYQIIRYRNELGRGLIDYAITLDFAKELSMMSQCEKGKIARQYFIACEKKLKELNQPISIPKSFAEALQLAADQAKQIELQEAEIKELTPKAEVYDKISDSTNLLDGNRAAKTIGIGRNKLYELLRNKSIFMANNTPMQQYINLEYFVVKMRPFKRGDISTLYPQTFFTGKGINWLSKQLK
jgi:anti-repressor protein